MQTLKKGIKGLILSLLLITNSLTLFAQFSISGRLSSNGSEISYANIQIKSVTDSSFVKGAISDDSGYFIVKLEKQGKYYASISFIGFKKYVSEGIQLSLDERNHDLGQIELLEDETVLREIEVKADRPFVIQKDDRTILNIQNRVDAESSSILEILERSPGVVVNRQSNSLALQGKEGVNVMINGRIQYMTPNALFNYLDSQSGSNIKSLELITSPPASLDAQGNAGFINIVLKSNEDEGLKGSFIITGGYGKGEVGNTNVSLQYLKDRLGINFNYSYLRNGQKQLTQLDRELNVNINGGETNIISDRSPTQNNQNLRLGIDFKLSDITKISFYTSGYSNQWDMMAGNDIRLSTSGNDSLIRSDINEENNWQHLQGNFSMTNEFNNGSMLTTGVSVLWFDNQNPINYEFSTIGPASQVIASQSLATDKDTPFRILVGKVDYSFPVNDKLKIMTGVKGVNSSFENDVSVTQNGVEQTDFTSTNDLEENIIAYYGESTYNLTSKLLVKSGLRYEYTETDLFSNIEGQVVDRRFGSLFPSILVALDISKRQLAKLSYNRRINRPSFSDMAPFFIFLDPNTINTGNSRLQPAISNNLKLDYNLNDISLSTQYSWEDSTIVRFQNRFSPMENLQLIIPDNLREQRTFSLSVTFPIRINEWWNMRYFGSYSWQRSTTVEPLGVFTFDQSIFRLNGNQTFKLPKEFLVDLSGFYQTTSLIGNVRFEPMGVLNVAIKKKIGKNSSISFNITDILNSLERIGVTDLSNEGVGVERLFDFSQRTFKITFSKSFGNSKIQKVNRNSSEEERRIN